MKELYFIASYDKETDAQIEQIPTTSTVFSVVRRVLGSNFDPMGDCFAITADVYAALKNHGFTLDLSKADYFIERAGDYELRLA